MENQALRVVPEPETPIADQESWGSAFQSVELDSMLMRHARWATGLASLASDVETQWWQFARSAEARLIPGVVGVIAKIDRIRAGMTDEALRVAEIFRAVPRSRMNVTVRDSNVLLTPTDRREKEAR